ncbi:MAG: hypothetical protein ACJAX3_001317 [Patiriisocius sp.]|jgi:hypothetical protein
MGMHFLQAFLPKLLVLKSYRRQMLEQKTYLHS